MQRFSLTKLGIDCINASKVLDKELCRLCYQHESLFRDHDALVVIIDDLPRSTHWELHELSPLLLLFARFVLSIYLVEAVLSLPLLVGGLHCSGLLVEDLLLLLGELLPLL